MPAHRRATSPRRPLAFVALFVLAALGAAAAFTFWPAAGQTASAQDSGSLEECHDLYLDMYIDNRFEYLTVTNRNDEETIANVMVELKVDNAADDDRTSQWVRSLSTKYGSAYGTMWKDADNILYWRLPAVPPGMSYQALVGGDSNPGSGFRRISRNAATMEQRVPGADTALCSTVREFWTINAYSVEMFSSDYNIGELSVDNRYPAPGGNVKFKVVGDSQDSVAASVKVQHTSGLEFQQDSNGQPKPPVIAPEPTTPRTLPLAVWRNYDATTGVGEFYIGNEGITRILERPEISITLPLKLKPGVKADGQCVTATITAMPQVANPNDPGANYDDPTDNTQTLCLGKPPAPSAPPAAGDVTPVLLTDGRADLLHLHGCVGKTTYPCDATDTVEQVVGGKDAAANAGLPYRYFQPEDVVVHIPDPAGRNKVTGVDGILWWSGSDQAPTGANHPGRLPGVAARNYFECVQDTDPNTPDNQPEYKGWKLAIADITDGQGNTIDRTPGSMKIWSMAFLKNHEFGYVDVDGGDDNKSGGTDPGNTAEFATFALCQQSWLLAYEFDQLGTYKADLTQETKYQESDNTETAYEDTGRYTFHVGPVAELLLSDRGGVPALASGETAYTLDLANQGPDVAESAKVVVKLPAGTTGVTTVPAGLGTFLAADTNASPARANPYWIWDAGQIEPGGVSRLAGRRLVTLVATGSANGAGTATVSNGNGTCSVTSGGNTTTLPHVIREADCQQVTGATWTAVNPYTVCIDTDHAGLFDVTPKPANKGACEATTGNKWYAGTVLDHRPGNNTVTLAGKTAPSAFLLTADAIDEQTVRLAWDGYAGADGYRIYRALGDDPAVLYRLAEVPAGATAHSDRTLTDGETRYYRVAARKDGEDVVITNAASATARLVAPLPPRNVGGELAVKPGAVANFAALRSSLNATTVNLRWDSASDASFYQVQYREASIQPAGGWLTAASAFINTKYQFTRAESSARYEFRVRAVNGAGVVPRYGEWSVSGLVPRYGESPPPGKIGDVRQETCDTCAATELKVSWAHAAYATHYQVQTRTQTPAGSAWSDAPPNYAITSSNFDMTTFRVTATLTGLDANRSYYVRVRGKNQSVDATPVTRDGLWTDNVPPSSGATGQAGAFGAAAATRLPDAPDAVGSVSVTHHGDSLSATWTAAARAAAYQVAYSGDNGATWTTAADAHGSTSVTIGGVDPDTTYLVSVRAYNDGGASGWTDSAPASPPADDDGDDDDG